MSRWTQWDCSVRKLRLVYVLSTGHAKDFVGYQPQLMRSTLVADQK